MIRVTSESKRSFAQMTIDDVEKGDFPRYLYKYRAPNEFTKNIIRNNALYYPTPLTFNDPFDCQIRLSTDSTYKQIVAYLRRNNTDLVSAEIKRQANHWFKNPRLFDRIINESARESFNNNGVSCFTSDPTSILMWSHYADSHKGICMKFDVLADPSAFFAGYKVNYEVEYPIWNHVRSDTGQSVTNLLTTKAKQWEYEQEYRVLKIGDPGNHSFAPSALVEIIFGLRCAADYIDDVKRLTNNSRTGHVAFSRTVTAANRFALELRPIPRAGK